MNISNFSVKIVFYTILIFIVFTDVCAVVLLNVIKGPILSKLKFPGFFHDNRDLGAM